MPVALLMVLLTAAEPAADTVVVRPAAFQDALQPWMEHRRSQGHVIETVSGALAPDAIRRKIRQVAKGGKLRFVVLVGDCEPDMHQDAQVRARCVPAHYAKAEVNVLWGSEPHIATDNWYADLEGDSTPELAVGRLTADSPDQLRDMVRKILAYERSKDLGPWRRRLNFVAGVGGFGPVADYVLESTARFFLTRGIPAEYRLSMTYGSWRSPFCPDPRQFRATTVEQMNEGSFFWVYIGHGHPFRLDRVRMPDGDYPILDQDDVSKLNCRHGSQIALCLACYTGAFDARGDCLAERMLQQPGGPVAVIAGSRVTMPYAMTLLATGLMDQCFKHRCPTLGEAVLRAKRSMMEPAGPNNPRRTMIDLVAKAVSPASDKLAAERAEHLLLFNLLGDPLLRLRYPKQIELEVPAKITAGDSLSVTGSSPVDGPCVVELVVRRDRLAFQPPPRLEYQQTPDALADFQSVYRRANDRRLVTSQVTVQQGRFSTRLKVPQDASGPCHVRVFIEGAIDFASGAADIRIEQAANKP